MKYYKERLSSNVDSITTSSSLESMKQFCFLILYISLSLGLNDVFADEKLWEQYNSAGETSYQQGDYREAIKQLENALKEAEKFGEEDPRVATSLNNLAVLYNQQGRYGEYINNKRGLTQKESLIAVIVALQDCILTA